MFIIFFYTEQNLMTQSSVQYLPSTTEAPTPDLEGLGTEFVFCHRTKYVVKYLK